MIYIEPLGTPSILPAIMVGYELKGQAPGPINMIPDLPDWLVTLDLQAGGYAVQQLKVAGVVLRLASNIDKGTAEFSKLIAGFDAMAEAPNMVVLSEHYPVLHKLCLTTGQLYDSAQLIALHDLITQSLTVPKLESGVEAFVRFVDCDPLAFFAGFSALSFELASQYYINHPGCLPANYARHADVGELEVTSDVIFSAAIIEQLKSFAQRFLMSERAASSPRCFLLWQNSD